MLGLEMGLVWKCFLLILSGSNKWSFKQNILNLTSPQPNRDYCIVIMSHSSKYFPHIKCMCIYTLYRFKNNRGVHFKVMVWLAKRVGERPMTSFLQL